MVGAEDLNIEKYGRHIPPILGKQLVLRLLDQYLDNNQGSNVDDHYESSGYTNCIPSIERFHGAMLFVDISGFTALSQRLNVDELRIHINGYFKKILDIVTKFNGEVIKFAGDALFIVWQTRVTSPEQENFQFEVRHAVECAVACGMEVNETCSNYKVTFLPRNIKDSLLTSALLSTQFAPNYSINQKTSDYANNQQSATTALTTESEPTSASENSETETFLNVHAGVSVGTMAGIDIGANDRWEYLLLGEPLSQVAAAETEAGVAEIVISPEAHEILHGHGSCLPSEERGGVKRQPSFDQAAYNKMVEEATQAGRPPPPLPCGCQLTAGGRFKVNQVIVGGSNLDEESFGEPDPEYEFAFYAEIMNRVTTAYDCMKPIIYHHYNKMLLRQVKESKEANKEADKQAKTSGGSSRNSDSPSTAAHSEFNLSPQLLETAVFSPSVSTAVSPRNSMSSVRQMTPTIDDNGDVLFVHYLKWMQSCLIDDLVRHVHEADRGHFEFAYTNRHECLLEFAEQQMEEGIGQLPSRLAHRHHLSLTGITDIRSPPNSFHNSSGLQLTPATSGGTISGHRRYSSDVIRLGGISNASSTDVTPRVNVYQPQASDKSSVTNDSFVQKIRTISNNSSTARKMKKAKHERVLQNDASLTAEQRNVIVLFIKIHIPDALSLYFDENVGETNTAEAAKDSLETVSQKATVRIPTAEEDYKAESMQSLATANMCTSAEIGTEAVYNSFNFLKRTPREMTADTKLLNRYQSCIEILTKGFRQKGGQMRQFIVDDKGTVCIGTFGLRGSVNNDNAAAAIETAQGIIAHLKEIGILSAVGITSGSAYCGIVGSLHRHEYAVMGPSTNLSARLMGKAKYGEIVCDVECRNSDRTHAFISLGKVNAKGYADPVPIFKPYLGIRHSMSKLDQPLLARHNSHESNSGSSGGMQSLYRAAGVDYDASPVVQHSKHPYTSYNNYAVETVRIGNGGGNGGDKNKKKGNGKGTNNSSGSIDIPAYIQELAESEDAPAAACTACAVRSETPTKSAVEGCNCGGTCPDSRKPCGDGGDDGGCGTPVKTAGCGGGGACGGSSACGSTSATCGGAKRTTCSGSCGGASNSGCSGGISNSNCGGSKATCGGGKTADEPPTVIAAVADDDVKLSPSQMESSHPKALFMPDGLIKPPMSLRPTERKIHGRHEEATEIYHFLLTQLAFQFPKLDFFTLHARGDPRNVEIRQTAKEAKVEFSVKEKSKLAIVSGPSGIGKTSFVNHFAVKLKNILALGRHMNFTVYQNKSTSFNISEPFGAWKSIIKQMLSVLSLTTMLHSSNPNSRLSVNKSRSNPTKHELVNAGLEVIWPMLSPELQELKPLLSTVHIVKGLIDNDVTSKLHGAVKLTKITELLSAIIQQYVLTSNKFAFIILDDLQSMDVPSWRLLSHLFARNTGMAILAAYRPLPMQIESPDSDGMSPLGDVKVSPKNEKIRTINNFLDSFSIITAGATTSNYKYMELLSFDEDSTRLLIKEILEINNMPHDTISEYVFMKIHELSDGNPLYIYELTHAMVEKYKRTNKETGINPFVRGVCAAHDNDNTCPFMELMKSFRTTRIEEVIFYRYDQLDPTSQLLLKMASVICANGAQFSLTILTYMLSDSAKTHEVEQQQDHFQSTFGSSNKELKSDDQDSSKTNASHKSSSDNFNSNINNISNYSMTEQNMEVNMNLVIAIRNMLKRHEFIKIANTSVSHSQKNSGLNTTNPNSQPFSRQIGGSVKQSRRGSTSDNSIDGEQYQRAGESRERRDSTTSSVLEENGVYIDDDALYGLDNNPSTAELSMDTEYLYSLTFEFRVSLEQSTIYDVMLNDQKESLHDRVASYYEQRHDMITRQLNNMNNNNNSTVTTSQQDDTANAPADTFSPRSTDGNTTVDRSTASPKDIVCMPLKPSELFEEGFHWEHAANWASAMCCYYRSANLLDSVGAYQENYFHLTAAYRMLNAMRRDVGVIEASIDVPASFQSIFGAIDGGSDCGSPRSAVSTATTLTKELVSRIFLHDNTLLDIGLHVKLKLGQTSFSLSNNYVVTSRLLEEALQIILLTWDSDVFKGLVNNVARVSPWAANSKENSVPSPLPGFVGGLANGSGKLQLDRSSPTPTVGICDQNTPERLMRRPPLKRRSSFIDRSSKNNSSEFGLQDPSICFPILAGIAGLYRNKRLTGDTNFTKEGIIYDLFLKLAKTNECKYANHLLVGYCFQRHINFERRNAEKTFEICDLLRSKYDIHMHANDIVQDYGNDRIPFTLSMNVQLLLFKGEVSKSKNYLFYLKDMIYPHITHLHSMAITILPILPVFITLGFRQKAKDLFSMYTTALAARSGYFSFFQDAIPLFSKWLKLGAQYEQYLIHGDSSIFNIQAVCDFEVQIKSLSFLCTTSKDRPLVFASLEGFGTSIEHICGSICVYKAKMWMAVLADKNSVFEESDDSSSLKAIAAATAARLQPTAGTQLSEMDSSFLSPRADQPTFTRKQAQVEILTNLDLALKYVEFSVQTNGALERLAFGYFHSLVMKADILVTMASQADAYASAAAEGTYTGEVFSSETRIQQARETLMSCLEFAKQNAFDFICMLVGVKLEMFEIDVSLGREIQWEYLQKILHPMHEFYEPTPGFNNMDQLDMSEGILSHTDSIKGGFGDNSFTMAGGVSSAFTGVGRGSGGDSGAENSYRRAANKSKELAPVKDAKRGKIDNSPRRTTSDFGFSGGTFNSINNNNNTSSEHHMMSVQSRHSQSVDDMKKVNNNSKNIDRDGREEPKNMIITPRRLPSLSSLSPQRPTSPGENKSNCCTGGGRCSVGADGSVSIGGVTKTNSNNNDMTKRVETMSLSPTTADAESGRWNKDGNKFADGCVGSGSGAGARASVGGSSSTSEKGNMRVGGGVWPRRGKQCIPRTSHDKVVAKCTVRENFDCIVYIYPFLEKFRSDLQQLGYF